MQNMRKLYNITNILDENGPLITSSTEQEERWQLHFCEVLNREAPGNPIGVEETDEICDINCEEPSILGITIAISRLKNGETPGIDHIIAEFLNADVKSSIEFC
jgi:hypothetical protein